MGSGTIRLGGVFGLVAAVAMIPAYLVGTPDVPRTSDEAVEYYESGSSFVTANGVVPLLHVLFGLVFVAVLASMLRSACGPNSEVYAALAGGVTFMALTTAGFAAEVAYPAEVLGVLPLLHTWIPLAAALSSLAWLGVTGLLMLSIPPVVHIESVGA
jgi:hypothetical protein